MPAPANPAQRHESAAGTAGVPVMNWWSTSAPATATCMPVSAAIELWSFTIGTFVFASPAVANRSSASDLATSACPRSTSLAGPPCQRPSRGSPAPRLQPPIAAIRCDCLERTQRQATPRPTAMAPRNLAAGSAISRARPIRQQARRIRVLQLRSRAAPSAIADHALRRTQPARCASAYRYPTDQRRTGRPGCGCEAGFVALSGPSGLSK